MLKKISLKILIFKQTGFTIIELMVVIAIIAVLAGLLISNYSGEQSKARDAKRKSDLKAIQTALQLYYNDHGAYPAMTNGHGDTGDYSTDGATWLSFLIPQYLKNTTVDPKNIFVGSGPYATGNYIYIYYTGDYCGLVHQTYYYLQAHLENINDSQAGKGIYLSSSCPNFGGGAGYQEWISTSSPQ